MREEFGAWLFYKSYALLKNCVLLACVFFLLVILQITFLVGNLYHFFMYHYRRVGSARSFLSSRSKHACGAHKHNLMHKSYSFYWTWLWILSNYLCCGVRWTTPSWKSCTKSTNLKLGDSPFLPFHATSSAPRWCLFSNAYDICIGFYRLVFSSLQNFFMTHCR